MSIQIVPIRQLAKNKVTDFFISHWGSPEMVITSGIYRCDELDGFVAMDELQEIVGLITMVTRHTECEIISLDSLLEKNGIGSSLVEKVEEAARVTGCETVKLITTNDNVHALSFYQKRGYRLTEIYSGAVDEARKIKPEIPLIADNGIPIHDELLLMKRVGR